MKKKPDKKIPEKKEDEVKILLENIVISVVGPGGEKLVDLLHNRQNVNEFLIAKKMDMTINQTRNMLYRLADEGIVGFIRKKDKKKGGWYTYFWTIKTKKTLIKFKDKLRENVLAMEKQLAGLQKGRFFYCKNCETEYSEEDAMLTDFTCPECGEVMEVKETNEAQESIRREIIKLRNALEKLDEEIQTIEGKEEKSKEKRLKAEKTKKDEERKKKRLERAAEKAKEKKKSAPPKKKKPAKKKTAGKKPAVKKKPVSKKKKR